MTSTEFAGGTAVAENRVALGEFFGYQLCSLVLQACVLLQDEAPAIRSCFQMGRSEFDRENPWEYICDHL
jgi:hypothetical protein